jgi:hypothetical protein
VFRKRKKREKKKRRERTKKANKLKPSNHDGHTNASSSLCYYCAAASDVDIPGDQYHRR